MSSFYSDMIYEKIVEAGNEAVFIATDFLDIADYETARKALNRLDSYGKIKKICRGVYYNPKFSELLGEYEAPSPHNVALALARKFNWNIAPSGNTALNQLGLSTQVTATWSYISDGPYRIYEWDSTKIEFKHRANREITGLSYITVLVVQALKILGKDNVTPEIIRILSGRLDSKDKVLLLKESAEATDWVHDIIKNI